MLRLRVGWWLRDGATRTPRVPSTLTTHGGAGGCKLGFLPPPPPPLSGRSPTSPCLYPARRYCPSPTRGIDISSVDRHLSQFNIRSAERLTRAIAHGKARRSPDMSPSARVWEGRVRTAAGLRDPRQKRVGKHRQNNLETGK